eukprot:12747786-Ditylum_brightwellii.AAC.1
MKYNDVSYNGKEDESEKCVSPLSMTDEHKHHEVKKKESNKRTSMTNNANKNGMEDNHEKIFSPSSVVTTYKYCDVTREQGRHQGVGPYDHVPP